MVEYFFPIELERNVMSPETQYADVFMPTATNIPLIGIFVVVAVIGLAFALFGKFYLNNWKAVIAGAVIFVIAGGVAGTVRVIHANVESQVIQNMKDNVKQKYNAEFWVDELPKAEDRDKPNPYTAKFIDGGKTEYMITFDRNTNEPSLSFAHEESPAEAP
jgi:hypothetical protein